MLIQKAKSAIIRATTNGGSYESGLTPNACKFYSFRASGESLGFTIRRCLGIEGSSPRLFAFGVPMQQKEFNWSNWKTPNTYDSDELGSLPQGCGIYLLVRVYFGDLRREILYVGQSQNVARRLANHPIRRLCDAAKIPDSYVRVYFRPCAKDALRIRERNLIQRLNPPYNIVHRRRGEL